MFSAVNHEFAKAHFEDPRRIDLKARSGELTKSPIMLVDFKLLHLLGKERDGPRVEEERALPRPCLNRFFFYRSVSHRSTCSAGPLRKPKYRFWGLGGVILSWCKLPVVGVKAGWCKNCLVQELVGAKAGGMKADL